MKKTNAGSLMVVVALLAACSTTRNSAPVVERNADGQMIMIPKTVPPAQGKNAQHANEYGYYTVKKGDTLTHIALDNGQNYRDLVTWNNLDNPNDIRVDQVLRVLPPDDHNASASVETVPIPSLAPQTTNAVTATVPLAPTQSVTGNKTSPRGEKKPYSDATLAEMRKPDVAAPAPAVAVAPRSPANAEKNVEPGVPEDVVSWTWPTEGKPLGAYEEGKKGIDIAGKSGQPVVAAATGKVLYAGVMRGYGNLVIIKHSPNLLSAYAHNKSILVKEGESVTKGQSIAEMGNSDADSVRLHFEIRQQGKPVDPSKFLPSR